MTEKTTKEEKLLERIYQLSGHGGFLVVLVVAVVIGIVISTLMN